MIKNLSITSELGQLKKSAVHKLVNAIKNDLNFKIADLTINFIHSDKLLELNRKHLKHNCPTDIITFNYSGSISNLDGEIYISFDDAIINSKKYKVSLNNELIRLVIHGILHLLGYNDKTASEKKIMKSLENQLTYKNIFTLL
ncbi:MAG TPA: rRNA maturation RNase YbeY [Ignavibacteriaceae bacterium]|nr:rRNA maturation RNase YbeY [Ignavibacteriaceae bacterium]